VEIKNNLIQFNAGKGIAAEGVNDFSTVDNTLVKNKEL